VLDGLRKALVGPKPLLGKDDCLFPNTAKGKPLAQAAVDEGYLAIRTETVPPSGRQKKGKEIVVAELTEKGRRHVLDADSPKAVLQALLQAVHSLAEPPRPNQATDNLRPELEKATQVCLKAIDGAFAKLQKTVEGAFAKLQEAVIKALPSPAPTHSIDPGPILAALQAALARVEVPTGTTVGAPLSPPHAPAPTDTAPEAGEVTHEPKATTAPAISSEQLRSALRQAYDHLCLFLEFRDKLVEIPRLYHETVRQVSGLSVERFHQELEALSTERKVELHKLNEVHMAKERNLAIEQNDRLYYYVFWK
jgi:hypothetical protein